ncbi:hypothetical protein BRADI_3g21215v3 [Brachypodium distachyon]|uniref:Protein kinase domain-containing protein n=1 Tax=Brachypodium distachyon TaxID=15368 RepID=A0A2K2CYK8_BRADI|nr:hypothetical protein BRADI_3g21215v3 [Brachypodium distachyon]
MSSGGGSWNKWNVRRALGQGASGAAVSLAADDASGELFVVKSATPGSGQLRREWALMSGLSSPHVVRCLGFRASGSRDHLLLEYAPGGSLADAARRRGMDEAEVRGYAADVLRALDYLHGSARVVHGDVKGGNVLVGADGRARLADFGCAHSITGRTTTMPLGGTPAFMAPEVARGEGQGPAADVWALGCTVVEMAAGGVLRAHQDDNVLAAVRRIGFTDDAAPEVTRWLSPAAKDFLGLCFRRRADERPTAAQLLEHPFVAMASCGLLLKKEELPVKSKPTWVSPTSALDAALWESDSEADDDDDDVSSSSPVDRIREMALSSSGSLLPLPDWISSDDGWIQATEK